MKSSLNMSNHVIDPGPGGFIVVHFVDSNRFSKGKMVWTAEQSKTELAMNPPEYYTGSGELGYLIKSNEPLKYYFSLIWTGPYTVTSDPGDIIL